jgi:hypothetical protein
MPNGPVVLDETIDLRVRIRKDALAIQNKCDIDIFGMSQTLRASLLSQFTAWNKRNLEAGQPGYQASYINIVVEAGYNNASQNTSTTVFKGQVATTDPIEGPPNIGVRVTSYSQQLSKVDFVTSPAPAKTTFKNYVAWVADQMGLPFQCETSYDNQIITNPSAQTMVVGALLIDIQNAYRPNVAAFIDNDVLIVKDINKVISSAQIVQVNEFIGTPLWTEWGVDFMTLFDPKLQLAGAASLQSKMNPSLNQTFVISSLEYDLCSRETPFYAHVFANPSA